MNVLRWIFGIPLAFAISMWSMYLLSVYSPISGGSYFMLSQFHRLLMIVTCFSSFVFLSCLFVPTHKKYAAIIAIAIGVALTGAGLYASLTLRHNFRYVNPALLLGYSACYLGLLVGAFVSYVAFIDNGWNAPPKPLIIPTYKIDFPVENEEPA